MAAAVDDHSRFRSQTRRSARGGNHRADSVSPCPGTGAVARRLHPVPAWHGAAASPPGRDAPHRPARQTAGHIGAARCPAGRSRAGRCRPRRNTPPLPPAARTPAHGHCGQKMPPGRTAVVIVPVGEDGRLHRIQRQASTSAIAAKAPLAPASSSQRCPPYRMKSDRPCSGVRAGFWVVFSIRTVISMVASLSAVFFSVYGIFLCWGKRHFWRRDRKMPRTLYPGHL